ncbi:MAG: RNA polymerase recycling motor HelD [Bacillota bacterium]|nr:RNA polymerase recycling motor HelD [Bacillota bacterium]
MSINKKEYEFEKSKLEIINEWLKNEISLIKSNDDELKEKIGDLKKQTKGKYNEELETAQKLYNITHKNLEKYNDSIEQTYFARIDFREYRKEKESYYIGKFGLGDSKTGDEVVVDWRAPIADLYYSGIQGDAYYKAPLAVISGELSLKRKFIIRESKLIDAFDDGINEIMLNSTGEDEKGTALIDEFLKINLEESVSSKLKEVVATIQKEQNNIIRANKNELLIVQGSAGSGKTTVALHRLAYLMYKYKNKLKGEDILVVAPNKLFLDYISEILPNLGVNKVKQKTYEEIAVEILELKGKIYSKDKKLSEVLESNDDDFIKYTTGSSKLKGSMMFKSFMDRYIRYLEILSSNVEDIKYENYVMFEKNEIKRLFTKDLINLSINKRKDEIKRYFHLKINDKIINILEKIDFKYEYQIARVKKTIEDNIERRKRLIEIYDERDAKKEDAKKLSRLAFENYFDNWKQVDTRKLYFDFFNEKDIFDEMTKGKIPVKLSDYIIKQLNDNINNGIIESDDLAAMLYLKFKIDGIDEKHKYQHIVVDEAQDYSYFQLEVLRNMAVMDSFTIVGDVGQGIYYYKGIEEWSKLISNVFHDQGNYVELTQSYRSTVEIIEFANNVLVKQNNSLKPALPVLRHGAAPEVVKFTDNKEFASLLDEATKKVLDSSKKSIAVIGRTYEECKKIKDILKKYSKYDWELIKDTDKTLKLEKIIIPSYMTKGLEFDCSILYNCNNINYSDTELNKKILYVALTRALHFEYILYNGELSPLII